MRFLLLAVICIVATLSVLSFRQYVIDNAVSQINVTAQRDLQLLAADAIAYTNKYAVAAVTLAKNPFVVEAVGSRNEDDLAKARESIQFTQLLHSATDVKVLVRDHATVIASANDQSIGVSMQDRSYVQAALSGRLGRESLYIGQVKRSYALAAPIFSESKGVIGVVLITASLNDLFNAWALSSKALVAETADQRVFLSNQSEWLGLRLTRDGLQQDNDLAAKPSLIEYTLDSGQVVLSYQATNQYRRFIKASRDVPLLQWQIHQFVSYRDVAKQANLATFVTLLLFGFIVLLWQIIRMRAQRLQREFEQQQEFARTLEERVARRTEELRKLNISLESEVQERRNAEQDLRKTQRGLVQATKMASIGQMSAALAHEYNQPISAIRFYADNSRDLFAKGDGDTLNDNLARIVSLTERMSSLTNSLRNFSYQTQTPGNPVKFKTALDEAIMLMKPKLSSEEVEVIKVADPTVDLDGLVINCGQIRVVQAITNLMSNAVDAMLEVPMKQLTLEWRKDGSYLELRVKDLGEGIQKSNREEVFDAFYTTKSMGKGLGLGLFVVKSIIESFDGTLTIEDEPNYGAVFAVRFPLVEQ
jgi:two-component system C4-dicarboxylate transport sensor histidine kinase DctB